MQDTTCHMSISLDGFVAGPEQSREDPLGKRGRELHGWHLGDERANEADETAARWVNLSSPNSSVPNAAVLGSGGFVDWSCDCDFGDLDNDGDMDLVHSSYGGVFGGQVQILHGATRIVALNKVHSQLSKIFF